MPLRERVGTLERHTGHLTDRREAELEEFGEALVAAAAAEENVPIASIERVGDWSVTSMTGVTCVAGVTAGVTSMTGVTGVTGVTAGVTSMTEATITIHRASLVAAPPAGVVRRGRKDSRG